MNRWSLVFRMLFGSLLLLLAACGGGPSTITVSGRVIDVLGQGVGGLKVRIGSTTVTTAANGSFSISGVTTPYDAVVFDTSPSDKFALYYKGLTRSDPTLAPLVASTSPHSATLSGNLSGLAGLAGAGGPTDILVFFDSPGPETLGGRFTISGNTLNNNTYNNMTTQWLTSAFSTTGKVYALEWTVGSGGLPDTYTRFGSRDVPTLTNGSTFNNQDVTLTPVTGTHTLGLSGGGVGFPTTYTSFRRVNVKLRIGSGSGTLLFTDDSPSTPSYKLPAISGATVSLAAGAADANGSLSYAWKAGLATNATNVSLSLPTAPTLSASATTNVKYSTVFTADFTGTNFSGGVNVFYFRDTASTPNDPDFYVITKANTTTIPNLSGIGLGLPPNTSYEWGVIGVAPFASINAAAGPGGFLRDFVKATDPDIHAAPNADGSAVVSAPSSFTIP